MKPPKFQPKFGAKRRPSAKDILKALKDLEDVSKEALASEDMANRRLDQEEERYGRD